MIFPSKQSLSFLDYNESGPGWDSTVVTGSTDMLPISFSIIFLNNALENNAKVLVCLFVCFFSHSLGLWRN